MSVDLIRGCACGPPAPPWVPMAANGAAVAYAAVYYSDPTSRLAVREVTRPGDNKSDPNLETGTFGLFSTCERPMRAGARVRNAAHLIFITSHQGRPRAVSGLYDLGWWAWGRLAGSPPDVCLAARELWFVEDPIPLADLPEPARAVLMTRFRTTKLLTSEVVTQVAQVVRSRPDATKDYIAEVDRLERFNAFHTGFRCWQRRESFSWTQARHLVRDSPPPSAGRASRNSSDTGSWTCAACFSRLSNRSRLKECPYCHAVDTLLPSTSPQ